MPNWSIGRTGQVYVAEEATYAVAPSLLATHAFRHLSINPHFDPFQPFKSPERHLHPSQNVLLNRRQAASIDLKGQWYPSGTLNTLPESDLILKNAMGGAATNITLATTLSSGLTATGGVVASATGLAVGQFVRITILSGGNAGTYMRMLTVVAGSTLTWAPALPGAPAASDLLKGCTTYSLATAKQKSLDIAHYPQAPSAWKNRELLGCVPNKLSWMFDSNLEPQIQLTGPAQGFAGVAPTWTAQAQPGGFTTVGAESAIPSGLTASLNVGAALYQFTKLQFDLDNGHEVQNNASGTNKAVDFYRKNKRFVMGKVSAMVSDDLTLYTPSMNGPGTPVVLLLQQGNVGGNIWAIYAPNAVITQIPDTPDGDADNQWAFTIECLGVNGNDEIAIGMA